MEWLHRSKEKGKELWTDYGSRLVLGMAFLLVGGLSFEAGVLQRSLGAMPEPVIIRIAEPVALPTPKETVGNEGTITATIEAAPLVEAQTECVWVGSKNSNKYHHPATRCAKQIKPANKVCFASEEAAKAKGYIAGCLQ